MKFKSLSLPRSSARGESVPQVRRVAEVKSTDLGEVRREFSRHHQTDVLGRVREAQREIALFTALLTKQTALNQQFQLGLQGLRAKEQVGQGQEGGSKEDQLKGLRRKEAQLQNITQKANEVKAHNQTLKQRISHSRQERAIFCKIFKSMEKELALEEAQLRELLLAKRQLNQQTPTASRVAEVEVEYEEVSQRSNPVLFTEKEDSLVLANKESRSNYKKVEKEEQGKREKRQEEAKQNLRRQMRNHELSKTIKGLGLAEGSDFIVEAQGLHSQLQVLFDRHELLSEEVDRLRLECSQADEVVGRTKTRVSPTNQLQEPQTIAHLKRELHLVSLEAEYQEMKLARTQEAMVPLFELMGVKVSNRPSLLEFEEASKSLEEVLLQLQKGQAPLRSQPSLPRGERDQPLEQALQRAGEELQSSGIIGETEMRRQGQFQLNRQKKSKQILRKQVKAKKII